KWLFAPVIARTPAKAGGRSNLGRRTRSRRGCFAAAFFANDRSRQRLLLVIFEETSMPTTGHCLCRAIQYEYDGEPALVVHCHCESCRRQTSSSVATFVIVPKAALRFTQGQPKEFASSPGVHRSFCGACGSPLYYRTERRADQIDLYAGTLSDPAA